VGNSRQAYGVGATVAAVHQPNYLPWLGFFHKIRHCDVFIVLDDVQFPRRQGHGNWVNRAKVNVNGGARWLSIPVSRPRGTQLIRDVRAVDDGWRNDHRRTIDVNYRSAPFYAELKGFVETLYEGRGGTLMEFNLGAIMAVLDLLDRGDGEKVVMASGYGVASAGTDRLVDLVRSAGASVYVTGRGAGEYLEPEKFAAASLSLAVQQFAEVERPQLRTDSFVPGLSILDALLMVGVEGVNAMLDATTPIEG